MLVRSQTDVVCCGIKMTVLKVFLFIAFAPFVLSENSLLTPCKVHDTVCLSKTTEQFLEQTCKGIPEYDIRAIDPLFIPKLDFVLSEEAGILVHYENTTVTGLKNQKFSEFKMDTAAKSVVLQTKVQVDISSHVTITLSKIKKTFSGPYEMKGIALGTAKYGYDFKTDDKGIEHYEVGPETITCEALGEPTVTFGSEFNEAVEQDADLKEQKEKHRSKKLKLKQKQFCNIVSTAYVTVVHNIRAAAKILPKTAFLEGV